MVTVNSFGCVGVADRQLVITRLTAFAGCLPGRPELRVKLTAARRVNRQRSSVVQANLEIDGWLIARAQVAANDFARAAELAVGRLGEHFLQASDRLGARAWPDAARDRPEPAAKPPAHRAITREKRVTLIGSDAAGAALVMDVMDYDFHLFVDTDTGQDSVVYRVGPTGYRLASLDNVALPAPGRVPWTVNVHPVPRLTHHQAVTRLNELDLPFRFFREAETNRGAVIYRRLDGHYGLLGPAV